MKFNSLLGWNKHPFLTQIYINSANKYLGEKEFKIQFMSLIYILSSNIHLLNRLGVGGAVLQTVL